jgi:hypothetical protein
MVMQLRDVWPYDNIYDYVFASLNVLVILVR